MKSIINILLCLVIITSCKKEEKIKSGKVTFYQFEYKQLNQILFVDGNRIGKLNAITQIPACGSNGKDSIITMDLLYGNHEFWIETGTGRFKQTCNIVQDCQTVKVKFN